MESNCGNKTEFFFKNQNEQLKRLDQIIEILNPEQSNSVSNDHKTHRRSQSAFTTLNDQHENRIEIVKTDISWEQMIDKMEKLIEKAEHCVKTLYADLQQEKKQRNDLQNQLDETKSFIDQDRTKRISKLRNYASLADDEGDILLSSLMKKAENNDAELVSLKNEFNTNFKKQNDQIERLLKEREVLHLQVQRLEKQNRQLAAITNDNETLKILTLASVIPTDLQESFDLIGKLRNEIIQQIKIREKLSQNVEQLQSNHQIELREREKIEEMMTQDLNAARDQIAVLKTVQNEFDRIFPIKISLEKRVEVVEREFDEFKIKMATERLQFKQRIERLEQEKEDLTLDNVDLRGKNQQLKIDFENMESVQHDFVKLSQSLQIQLEEMRNGQHELRWQPEEDFSHCQKCHSTFSVTWRKHHCRHCGKVLCKDCTNQTVYTGPNRRASRVCELCYTFLVKDSQPHFVSMNGNVQK